MIQQRRKVMGKLPIQTHSHSKKSRKCKPQVNCLCLPSLPITLAENITIYVRSIPTPSFWFHLPLIHSPYQWQWSSACQLKSCNQLDKKIIIIKRKKNDAYESLHLGATAIRFIVIGCCVLILLVSHFCTDERLPISCPVLWENKP